MDPAGVYFKKHLYLIKKNVKGDILCIKEKLTFKHNAYRSKHTTEKNIVQLLNSFFIGLLKKSYFNSV